jgi:hypothetical protein
LCVYFGKTFWLKFKSFHLDIIWKRYYQLKLAFGKVLIASQFEIKIQVKGLTHMFCLWISSHKLYKRHVFHWLFIKICICQFDLNEEMFDINWKLWHEWNIFWLFNPSTFSLSYLFAYLHKWVGVSFFLTFNFLKI